MASQSSPSTAVLVTGCSSGIGRATAERLAERGLTVYATARRPETIADLEAAGCRLLALDVTDEASMAGRGRRDRGGARRGRRARQQRRLLPVGRGRDASPMDEVRRQFETNVFGLVRMCQLVLPGDARAAARGGS